MSFAALREKSSQNADSFRVLRDETGSPQNLFCGVQKNRKVCLITPKESK